MKMEAVKEFSAGQVVYLFDGRSPKFEKVVIKEKHISNSYVCVFRNGMASVPSESLYPTLDEVLFEIDKERRRLKYLREYLVGVDGVDGNGNKVI